MNVAAIRNGVSLDVLPVVLLKTNPRQLVAFPLTFRNLDSVTFTPGVNIAVPCPLSYLLPCSCPAQMHLPLHMHMVIYISADQLQA